MKTILKFTMILNIILFTITILLLTNANACSVPQSPPLSPKPYWCYGMWDQQLVCDTYCNCHWKEVCIFTG